MEEIKPCPVPGCNGKGKIEHNAWDGFWWVQCSKCHKMGPIVYCNRQQAIDAWNKRSQSMVIALISFLVAITILIIGAKIAIYYVEK